MGGIALRKATRSRCGLDMPLLGPLAGGEAHSVEAAGAGMQGRSLQRHGSCMALLCPGRLSKTSLHVPRATQLTHPGQQAPQRHACHQWPARIFQASSETLLSPAAYCIGQFVTAASMLLSHEAKGKLQPTLDDMMPEMVPALLNADPDRACSSVSSTSAASSWANLSSHRQAATAHTMAASLPLLGIES